MLVLGYIVLAVVGAGYILVSMLLGHLVDVGSHDPGAHAGADAHTATADYGVEHSGHGDATAGDGVAPGVPLPLLLPARARDALGVDRRPRARGALRPEAGRRPEPALRLCLPRSWSRTS